MALVTRYKKYAGGTPNLALGLGQGAALVGQLSQVFSQPDRYGKQSFASNVLGDAGNLAATGAAFGPVGAAIGGGLGIVKGIFDNAAQKRRRAEMMQQERDQQASENAQQSAAYLASNPNALTGNKGVSYYGGGGDMKKVQFNNNASSSDTSAQDAHRLKTQVPKIDPIYMNQTLPPVKVVGFKGKDTRDFFDRIKSENPAAYSRLIKIGKKYGFPSIKYDSGTTDIEGKNHGNSYNPVTNTIRTQKNSTGVHTFLDEMPHKIQFDKHPILNSLKWLSNDAGDWLTGNDPYKDPKAVEYQAHGEIKDKLLDQYYEQAEEDNQYATGGSLVAGYLSRSSGGYAKPLSSTATEIEGPSHADGGVKFPDVSAELEGGETTDGSYVFSKQLGFAQIHKPIARAIGKIENKAMTPERINSLRLLRDKENKLKASQEFIRKLYKLPEHGV